MPARTQPVLRSVFDLCYGLCSIYFTPCVTTCVTACVTVCVTYPVLGGLHLDPLSVPESVLVDVRVLCRDVPQVNEQVL